ncbi:hypothetical protein JKA74_15265 [Marivirga sp. S37H4]|uniref:Lipoprotein n=1 Tax=Marivirga aurantiaca TaxID=2802615 RepID=A0A934X026_9BACT|nr:hypothetical protein [Marivirga aurantiaca]MBK6266403.1 hypothetical protein [Marivirga aurantiaca]
MKILLSLICFSIILSCQQPSEDELIHDIHNTLITQRQYFYHVEYAEGSKETPSIFRLFGTGKLSRNKQSSISQFYFGLNKDRKDNYLHLIQYEGEAIEQLHSLIFDEAGIDVLTDSLHSAILLNPDLILSLKKNSDQVSTGKIENDDLFFIEFINKKEETKIVLKTDPSYQLTGVNIYLNYGSGEQYYRSWSFQYLDKGTYQEQIAQSEKQLQSNPKTFL